MSTLTRRPSVVPTGWYAPADCDVADLAALCETATDVADYPHADEVVQGVLVYGKRLRTGSRREVQAELARALAEGPGVLVVRDAVDRAVVDRATAAFEELIARQKAEGATTGDHFAAPGANDRVWGALDKLAVAFPETFVDYYANDVLALVSEAWLGRGYQVTSQVNVVNPGGQAQVAHRDYHLGFMDRDQAMAYPAQVHALSPLMTLQGAVAHCDMPVETGPTMFLPHSQKLPAGYVAFHDPAFTAYFEEHHVQLPLAKGDAVFFNPALFHGAGTNRTSDVRRMANLLQVSSAFGRAMETVDTTAMCRAVFPVLRGRPGRELDDVVAVVAEAYAFPTNLDHDAPIGSMAPPTQADLLHRAVAEDWSAERFDEELTAQEERRRSRARTAR
ncbi:phytanoyl-CoA dioxygenase family protein [Nocardioides marmoribigeumensis]|uniref:Ectoine hydroxylase-related dioxygenase (Phytanoyl-CoA dioxygenase family) n=1 Tax=Nocardioides marmoribigeumensis TaxID=433649 RepID=A0ABU2BT89_9ACTN|nr:phytanoyl-CoA dioxygenase family protein [Nocardioides marmoribigeumensis]MDR7361842.1 ectoine hydroxylase-related dioxygenase (phytanoyl-CoA dioxygenase family) [Nocardioides marmoribigeumensis]